MVDYASYTSAFYCTLSTHYNTSAIQELVLTLSVLTTLFLQKQLSYRKQIARQLRTQYVEGIHRPKYYTVTLKSRLSVTQDHRKRNHLDRSYTTYY